MDHSIRTTAPHFLLLAAAVAFTSVPPRAAAEQVQDLGRIEASGYDAQVYGQLARLARHPDFGSASPRRLNGKVDVAFEVGRDGTIGSADITQSSQSNALDGAALRAVRRARFQPPAGEPRRYQVTFDYRY